MKIRTSTPFILSKGISDVISVIYDNSINTDINQTFLVLIKWKYMGLSGLEPPTSRLSGVRSNRLSYKPMFYIVLCPVNIMYNE